MAKPYTERSKLERTDDDEPADSVEDIGVAAEGNRGLAGDGSTRGVVTANEKVNGVDSLQWDVFVSHSSCQTPVARGMKDELSKRGFKVFIYEDDVLPGSSILSATSNAIYKSRRCVMLVSREFIESTFFVSEYGYAMEHQNRKRIISCLPVLYELQVNDLPAEFRHLNCLHYDDEKFYEKLEKAIRDDVRIETQITVTQTGVGLAWSYFYGYLDIILPGLEERVIKQRTKFKIPVYPKMIVILPVSCRCPTVMPEKENFRHMGFIEHNVDRAANRARCYKSTVYDFTFSSRRNDKQVHCHLLMEFATPLLSLYQMNEGNIAQLKKGQMTNERHLFKEVVTQILNYESMENCRGKYLLIDYRDEDEQTTSHKWTKETLSQVVAREVENDMIANDSAEAYLFPVKAIPTTAESISTILISLILILTLISLIFMDMMLEIPELISATAESI